MEPSLILSKLLKLSRTISLFTIKSVHWSLELPFAALSILYMFSHIFLTPIKRDTIVPTVQMKKLRLIETEVPGGTQLMMIQEGIRTCERKSPFLFLVKFSTTVVLNSVTRFHTPTSSPKPAGHSVQPASDTIHLELAFSSYKGPNPQDSHSIQMPIAYPTLSPTSLTISSGLVICKSGSHNSGKHIYQFIIKTLVKDVDQQPEEEMHRARSGRVLSTRTSLSHGAGVHHMLACGCVPQPGSSMNWYFRDLYGTQSLALH